MAVGSNVNPNYPIPGIDQSSKGFRDNFSTIKVEIENLQSKNIVLQGDATGNAIIDGGTGDVVINTIVSVANIAAATPDRSIQFNNSGTLDGTVNLVWSSSEVLVIGGQVPDTVYSLDTQQAKIHNNVLIHGDSGTVALNMHSASPLYSNIDVISTTSNNVGMANINVSNADAITVNPLNIQFNGTSSVKMNAQGLAAGNISTLGASNPNVALEVYEAVSSDTARFVSVKNNSDNTIRFTTTDINSSAGIALQQSIANSVVGIRVGQNGYFSIHTGLNNNANLDDSSQVVTIDTTGQVGIGIPDPLLRLDVDGNIGWTLPGVANVSPYNTTIIGVTVDSWDVTAYRSADYTIQCTDPTGAIEITKLLVMHDNGTAYQYIYANLNSSGGGTGPATLGTATAAINGSVMELIYASAVNGSVVKVDATYITI